MATADPEAAAKRRFLLEYVRSVGCRRMAISGYMDGCVSNCQYPFDQNAACDNCSTESIAVVERDTGVSYSSIKDALWKKEMHDQQLDETRVL